MRTSSGIAILCAFQFTATYALASDCGEVYAAATHNVRTNERESSELLYYYNKLCLKSGEVNKSVSGASLDAILEKVPFKFAFSSTTSTEKALEFCRVGNTLSTQWEKESSFVSTVVAEALSGFNECKAIEMQGILITHQLQPPQSLIITGSPHKISKLEVGSVTLNNMTCDSTSFSKDGSRQPFDGSHELKIPENGFSIACTRTNNVAEGKAVYPRASMGMGTSIGPYTIILQDEELNGYDLASTNRNAYETLMNAKDEQAKELAARISTLQARLDNVMVTPFVFYTADGSIWNNIPYGGAHNTHDAYANKVCSKLGATPVLVLVSDLNGGSHGMKSFAGACVKK